MRIMLLLASASLMAAVAAGPAHSASSLPPTPQVLAALDGHPTVAAARARLEAARAQGVGLRRGAQETVVNGSYIRRSVDREGGYDEFDVTVSRPFRLPGKAGLDREAGNLGVDVAENRMEDVRHQTALELATLWFDWLTAGELHRNDRDSAGLARKAVEAVRLRRRLRDASDLEVDQAVAALGQIEAQAAASLAEREQARAKLAANFPDLVMGEDPPPLAAPVLPDGGLDRLRDKVVENSHEIVAADREAMRMDVLARRARADRMADPSFGVRMFSERSGMERGAGVVASIPLGGGHRRALADQAGAEADAARFELSAVQRSVEATASADLSGARSRHAAWVEMEKAAAAADAAAGRTEQGNALGHIDLADLLYARRQARETRRAEIEARAEAHRAITRLRIDAHALWLDEHVQ